MRRRSRNPNRDSFDDPIEDLDQTLAESRPIPRPSLTVSRAKATSFNDLRRWAPDRLLSEQPREPVRDVTGRPARIVYKVTTPKPRRAGGKLQQPRNAFGFSRTLFDRPVFADVKRTTLCTKRKTRRETLFALKRTGRGARSPKRRNQWSSIKCSATSSRA